MIRPSLLLVFTTWLLSGIAAQLLLILFIDKPINWALVFGAASGALGQQFLHNLGESKCQTLNELDES
jgi:hypothetical protein